MKSFGALTLLLSVCSVSAVVPLSNVQRKTNLPIVPNRFIVEVDNVGDVPNQKRGIVSVGCFCVIISDHTVVSLTVF